MKFFEHYRVDRLGARPDGRSPVEDLWDEEDGFFYDVLRLPDGGRAAAQGALDRGAYCRSALPPCSSRRKSTGYPTRSSGAMPFLARFPHLAEHITLPGQLAGYANGRRLPRGSARSRASAPGVLHRMLDEAEFLSPTSEFDRCRFHQDHPYRFLVGERASLGGLSAGRIWIPGSFGGNSNWRGPVWMPINQLDHVRALPQPAPLLWR